MQVVGPQCFSIGCGSWDLAQQSAYAGVRCRWLVFAAHRLLLFEEIWQQGLQQSLVTYCLGSGHPKSVGCQRGPCSYPVRCSSRDSGSVGPPARQSSVEVAGPWSLRLGAAARTPAGGISCTAVRWSNITLFGGCGSRVAAQCDHRHDSYQCR